MNARIFIASALVLVVVTPTVARADDSKAAAVALFDEGQRLMGEANYGAACLKLAESHRIDPQLGALLHLSACYEKAGKLASAWASWRDAAEIAQQRGDSREALARAHATTLEPKLAKLVVHVPADSDAPGLEVLRDGIVLSRSLWGTPVPVDAGEHVIEASAPGKVKLVAKVTVAKDGVVEAYTMPALNEVTAAPTTTLAPSTAPVVTAQPDSASNGSTQRTLALVAGGLGVVALGAGGYFTLKKSSLDDDRAAICPSGAGCAAGEKAEVEALNGDIRDMAKLQTISFAAGGVLLSSAIVLWLTAPSSEPARAGGWAVAPAVAEGTLGVAAAARW